MELRSIKLRLEGIMFMQHYDPNSLKNGISNLINDIRGRE